MMLLQRVPELGPVRAGEEAKAEFISGLTQGTNCEPDLWVSQELPRVENLTSPS